MANDAGKRNLGEGEDDATSDARPRKRSRRRAAIVTAKAASRTSFAAPSPPASARAGAAARSKDDIMRAAAGEVRNWLEHMNFNEELMKALSKMVIEVKTEVRFRPTEDGKVVPETSNDVKVKPGRAASAAAARRAPR